jgi:hypothetical protein
MSGETFAALLPPTGAAFVPGHAARASQIEQVRQNLTILGKPRYWHLGSAGSVPVVSTAYVWADDAPEVMLCAEDVRGLTLTLRVWLKVADALGTVRVRLQNVDDAVVLAELGAPVADLDWVLYELSVAPPPGTVRRKCRLEIKVGDAAHAGYYRGAQLELKL